MLISANPAWADSRWYLGGGIGITRFSFGSSVSAAAPDIDSNESGYQAFFGGKLGTHWALEAGYVEFGEAQGFNQSQEELTYSAAGAYANAQYHIPLAKKLSLDLVGGWLFGTAEAKNKSAANSDSAKFDDNGGMLGFAFTWLSTDTVYLRGTGNYYLVNFDNSFKEPWRLGIDVIWDF
jgi:hypothetical protein